MIQFDIMTLSIVLVSERRKYMVTELNNENFDEVINSNDIVIVDFYADWCGPCMMMGPIVDAFSEEHTNIKVAKVNIDDEMDLAAKNRVSSIPTLVMFKGGVAVKRNVGALSKMELEAFASQE